MNKTMKWSRGISIKLQLYIALMVIIMFSQLVAYIAYTFDPGALVVYQPDFWKRGIVGLLVSLVITTLIFLLPSKAVEVLVDILGRIRYWLMVPTIVVLVLLLTPIVSARYGSRRWLFGFQVSDIAKFVSLIFVSYSLATIWAKWREDGFSPYRLAAVETILSVVAIGIFLFSFILPAAVGLKVAFTTLLIYVFIVAVIEMKITGKEFGWLAILYLAMYVTILLEPDISTSSLFAIWFLFMLMLWYGKRGINISVVTLIGIFVSALQLRWVPLKVTIPHWFIHAVERLLVWRDPFVDPNGISYHMVKNYLAVFKGGLWGSYPISMSYVPPVPWSDSILPFLAVTLGTIFEILLVFLFIGWGLFFLISGLRMRDVRGLFVTGFALWFLLQLTFNMLSTYDIFPPTGISIPFLSWGRTGLIIFTLMNSIAAVFIAEDLEKALGGRQ